MKFVAKVRKDGKLFGRRIKITWEDGKISCDDPTVIELLHFFAQINEGRPLRDCYDDTKYTVPLPKGVPVPVRNHIRNPFAVCHLIEKYIGKIVKLSGDPPYKWYGYKPWVIY